MDDAGVISRMAADSPTYYDHLFDGVVARRLREDMFKVLEEKPMKLGELKKKLEGYSPDFVEWAVRRSIDLELLKEENSMISRKR